MTRQSIAAGKARRPPKPVRAPNRPREPEDIDFQAQLARKLERVMRKEQLSAADIGKVLGLSREGARKLLNENFMPSFRVLAKACIAWNLRFTYRGWEFSARPLREKSTAEEAQPVQLELFADPVVLENGDLLVKIGSDRSESSEATVEIKFKRPPELAAAS